MLQIIGAAGPSVPLGGGFFMAGMRLHPPTIEPELPEFAFSPRERYIGRAFHCVKCEYPIHEARGERNHRYLTDAIGEIGPFCPPCAEWAHMSLRTSDTLTLNPKPKAKPAIKWLAGHGPSLPITANRALRQRPATAGGADPVWDTRVDLKWAPKPKEDAPLLAPKGAAKVIASFLDRVAEIDAIARTQHLDFPPEVSMMRANGIAGFLLDADPRDDASAADRLLAEAERAGEPRAQVLRLPDTVMKDPETGIEYPIARYADMVYIAALMRRIEWERFISACGPLERAYFAPTKDGRTGIEAVVRKRTPDYVLEFRRAVKALWLKHHAELPTPAEIEALGERTKGQKVLDRLTDNQRERYDRSLMYGEEDPDPWRYAAHADPDPKPTRDEYPFGGCWRHCTIDFEDFTNSRHNGCTIDGHDLFQNALALWEHAHAEDVGYAGPVGQLGVDEEFQFPEE